MASLRTVFSIRRLISLGLVLNLFLMRPSALGERYTAIGVLIAPLLTGMYLFHTQRQLRYTTPRLRAETAGLLAMLAMYWTYVAPVSILNERSQLDWTLYELITTGIIALSYSAFLLDVNANRLFFRQLCTVVALLGLSSLLTELLTLWLGSKSSLYLFSLPIKGYAKYTQDPRAATGAIYFPFSMLYSDFASGTVKFDRYCAFFREAGIYQAVACFCLIYEALTRRSRFLLACLVGGIICAFSTLGIALLALSLGLLFTLSGRSRRLVLPRLIVAGAIAMAAWPVALYTPYIGIEDKVRTHGESITDRSRSIDRGLAHLAKQPFGVGLFSGTEKNDGISLLAQIGMIGLFGFACQVVMLSAWRPGVRPNWSKMGACAPLLITALFAQPIAGAPTIYVILLAYLPRLRREPKRVGASRAVSATARSTASAVLGTPLPVAPLAAMTHSDDEVAGLAAIARKA
ncbi:hypothetical protein [Caballeronia grimmiae]|uniref:hypothetical protein n=1 Tax=Caballeronia grimmiae TaxID=1071679 RepID=UPI0038BCA514